MRSKKILFVYRTPRKKVNRPDSLLFGANHLKKMGYNIDFTDAAYSSFNIMHPIFYPLEHAIIKVSGMGFKIAQAAFLYPKFRNYDILIGTGDSAGLPLLAFKYFGLVTQPVIFMTAGLAGALKGIENTWVGRFYKKILPMADVFTSYSRVEIDYFERKMGIKKGKIIYMPLATDADYFSRKAHPKDGTVICAVGTEMGRDYKTLFAAVGGLPIQVEVACHPDNITGLTPPANVKISLNIPVQEVLKLYQRSIISIVPCFERFRSSGQMVLLESAAAGLPIIASKIQGLVSAFDFQDKKHLLYFHPQNPLDLRQKILFLLANPKVGTQLGRQASTLVKNNYTTYHLAKRLAEFIQNL